MPRYICKFEDGGRAYYLEWSTVVDAPVTFGMTLGEFRDYYRGEYGNEGMRELEGRLARVEEKRTSSRLDDSLDDLISHNRAGRGETRLSREQILEAYCRNPTEEPPEGERRAVEEQGE